jgi:hypothetical protein
LNWTLIIRNNSQERLVKYDRLTPNESSKYEKQLKKNPS